MKHFSKGFLNGKLLAVAPKLWKSADKSISQPWCSHSQYDLRCPAAKENNITHAAAVPSNLDVAIIQCDLQRPSCKTQKNYSTRNGVGNCSSKTGSRRLSDKKTILKHFLKGFLKRKITSAIIEKICWQITVAAVMHTMHFAASRRKPARIYEHGNTRWQQSCSHSNAIDRQPQIP